MTRFRAVVFTAAIATLAACGTPPPTPTAVTQAPPATATTTAATTAATAGKTEILWLGQAAVRITSPGGKVIVIDPWLTTNPKTPAGFRQLPALGKVDVILVTHAHNDHLGDAPALAQLNNAPIYNGGGMGQALINLGMVPAALVQRFGKSGTVMPFGPTGPKITAVHAEHSSELVRKNPATGKDDTHYGGEPVGYIVEMENGFRVWHMGDTGLFGDMRLIGERYRPDLVLVPIGDHFTMGPQDAAIAVRDLIRPRFAIPIHYQTSPQLRGTPQEFNAALGTGAATRVIVPQPGEKVDF
ncbi:metal-dependent hydrolase [Cupriavidus taiwanensis]|uniref:UPF0173 metal-dependent hydrolase CBM2587_A160124 n=1 Tax=Cupriavidus taiwanensis TaxID=164546 RepID=A0A375BIQ6_9BURK|nr:conserved exported hypothetical protein [Cupriavidus taiwanensis]